MGGQSRRINHGGFLPKMEASRTAVMTKLDWPLPFSYLKKGTY